MCRTHVEPTGKKSRPSRSQSVHTSVETGQCPWSEGTQEDGCGMNDTTEATPAAVPEGAKQVGEVRTRWAWTEPSVWTDRMLTTLEHGVKGGCWYSLIDKVYDDDNLFRAYTKEA